MEALRHILAKYVALALALLSPLGVWGVFAIGLIDAALVGMPLDPLVARYVYVNPGLAWLYVLMAAGGSAIGNIALYVIGYKGGEALLRRRMSPEKFEKIRESFERNRVMALMVPGMIPPPFPYKILILAAAAFEMNFWHFLGAIFVGRLFRFGILAVLTVFFGQQFVAVISHVLREHLDLVLIGLAVIVGLWLLFRRFRRGRAVPATADSSGLPPAIGKTVAPVSPDDSAR